MSESPKLCNIPASKFYINYNLMQTKIKKIEERNHNSNRSFLNFSQQPQRLFGPTQYVGEFYKQADALEDAEVKNVTTINLLTFVYEQNNGRRKFVTAHPEVFWWNLKNKLPEERCAYEIIPSGAPCSLYLDLEFQKDLNQNSNGPRMTTTLIDIICAYMKYYWDIICDEKNIINLDSTTNTKFSRHVIFRVKNIAFEDNIHLGRFIKKICADIDEYLGSNCRAFHNVLSYFNRGDLEELIIETGKNKKIFIDISVYKRNQHFRTYQATKWGKLSHLKLAPENKYIPLEELEDKELGIFLESLISYFPDKKLICLKVNENLSTTAVKYTRKSDNNKIEKNKSDCTKKSPYPAVDKFILDLVFPGTIRELTFFETSQTIIYEITGNRYCANIGRPHKSNNIYWVADLKRQYAYQKCHDQDDCANFKSKVTPFPNEISVLLDDKDDDLFFNISDNFEYSTESMSPNNSC